MTLKKVPFQCTYTPEVPQILNSIPCSLLISTYQAGKLIVIGPDGKGGLVQLPRNFKRAMGTAIDCNRIAVAAFDEVVVMGNSDVLAQGFPKNPNQYDAMYVPHATYYCGEVDVHDMHWGKDGRLYGITTRFSSISIIGDRYSIEPYWTPPFIKVLDEKDRCHLNGMAMVDDMPKYVTAFGTTSEPKGWRPGIMDGGIVMDIESNEVICGGLAMPHSPRVYDGELYVLLSATGQLIHVDVQTGKNTVISQLRGFVRGMAKWGDYLFIGLSKIRKSSSVFRDLPIRYKDVNCGVAIVHLPSGATVGTITYKTDVEELYDIQVLYNKTRPCILNHTTGMYKAAIHTPTSNFWSERALDADM